MHNAKDTPVIDNADNDSVLNHRTLDNVVAGYGSPLWRNREKVLTVLFIIVVLWMAFAQVDRVVTAQGKVVPFNKVKIVQHLEGGIIEKVLVRENDLVVAGQPLIELDLATSGVNGEELATRYAALDIARKRLVAESTGTEVALSNNVPTNLRATALAEENTYATRMNELQQTLSAIDEQKEQASRRVNELKARQNSLEQNLSLAAQQLAISTKLVADKLVSELEHFERLKSVETLKGDIAETKEAINGALSLVLESDARKRQEHARFKRSASDELGDVERRMASLQDEINRANDQKSRAIVRAPIDGIVKNLKYQAIGNVVKPGEPIMEVVPVKDRLVIEIKLLPMDRGYVIEEQSSLVKISAFDYYRYGGLDGRVIAIAADTDVDKDESQFYRVIIETEKNYVGDVPGAMKIKPGMTAEVSIKIDSQSVLWALLRPILKIKHEALRET